MNCCICGVTIVGQHGNNPWPVKDSGSCCDLCNITTVLNARLKMLKENKTKEERGKQNEKRKDSDKCQ